MSSSFDLDLEPAAASPHVLWSVDFPTPKTRVYGDRLEIFGWAIGTSGPALRVEVGADGHRAASAIPALARPDVAAAFPHIPHAGRSGFSLLADVPEHDRVELVLSIVLPGGEKVEAARIRLTRQSSEERAPSDAPLVSVVIPCYNQGRFLADAIESVRRQTYPRVELVVVDDGSTDETHAVASELGVRCIHQENRGLSAARNRGLAESAGEYLVFLDADDRLLPHGIEASMDAFDARPDAAFVSGWFLLIDESGDPLAWPMMHPLPPEGDEYTALLENAYWTTPAAVMFRRAPVLAVGGFGGRYGCSADSDLYFRLARDHPVYLHAGGPIVEHREHPASMSADSALSLVSTLAAIKAQREFTRDEPELRAAYRRGLRRLRDYFGEAVADDLASAIRGRKPAEAIRAAWALARCYPGGFSSSLAQLARPRRVGSRAASLS